MLGRKSNDIQKRVYENEIKRLTKERDEYKNEFEIANRYKAQYEELADEYKRKYDELKHLKQETDDLNTELKNVIDNAKKRYQ